MSNQLHLTNKKEEKNEKKKLIKEREEKREFLSVNEAISVGVEESTMLTSGSSGHTHSFPNLINNLLSRAPKSCLMPEV